MSYVVPSSQTHETSIWSDGYFAPLHSSHPILECDLTNPLLVKWTQIVTDTAKSCGETSQKDGGSKKGGQLHIAVHDFVMDVQKNMFVMARCLQNV